MTWHEVNERFNSLINKLFHDENWQERGEAARELGFMKDGRATNLMCRALQKEKDKMVCNRIIEAMGRIGDPKATMIIASKLKEEMDAENPDKFTIIHIIESFINLKDKRALVLIGPFLSSEDEELKKLTQKAFDTIEPEWRYIVEKEFKKNRSIEEILKKSLKTR
ncbi:MAG: HEAT repeat domain-containing protein [Candidatus Lokiarchaeota archaeon]|nr:HEAT repeat domain-containing protein [Candidatus Lokiarchaeota archaeon]